VNDTIPAWDELTAFCRRERPTLLAGACKAPASVIEEVSVDILSRAQALSQVGAGYREVLAAPFVEESFHHRPRTVSAQVKALTTVVVRNSKLEDLHVHWDLEDAAVAALTTTASEILDRWLLAASEPASAPDEPKPFEGLDRRHPLAWACVARLSSLVGGGGHVVYEAPPVPSPALPGPDDRFDARRSTSIANAVVFSGIDTRFDQGLIGLMGAVAAGTYPVVVVSALSRLSRDWSKMARVLEFCLAHESAVLTTNSMLSDREVWVRDGHPIRPDSSDPLAGLRHLRGLSGRHLSTVLGILEENRVAPHRQTATATRARARRRRK
jgi:hypothetical protein